MNDFRIGDAITNTREHSPMVQTWIFDPPYNVGFRYDACTDNMDVEEYESFIQSCAEVMFDKTEEGGSCFLIHYTLPGARLIPRFEAVGWKVHQWITWVYPCNMGMSKRRFTHGSRVVLWFSKGEPFVQIKAVPGVFKNPNDRRVKKRIEEGHAPALMDWWEINLRKNVSKGYRGYSNQLPIELVRRCVLTTTRKGDTVGDLMAGSGTTWEVCKANQRFVFLNDLNPKCLELWKGIQ